LSGSFFKTTVKYSITTMHVVGYYNLITFKLQKKIVSMSITKHNWTKDEIIAIYNKPMMDLLY